MGNREALLAGARRVIAEHGLEGVTARRIASEAGVSLGAIGYHFGTKDELVASAVVELLDDGPGDLWASALQESSAPPAEAFAGAFQTMLDGLEPLRARLTTGLEAVAAAQRSVSARSDLAARQERALVSLEDVLRARWPQLRGKERRALARVAVALMHGVVEMWLVDPEVAPTGKQVLLSLGALLPTEAHAVPEAAGTPARPASGEVPVKSAHRTKDRSKGKGGRKKKG